MVRLSLARTKKIYIKDKHVFLEKGKVFVKTKKGALSIKALHSDKKGLYIFRKDVVQLKEHCSWPDCDHECIDERDRDIHEWADHRGFTPSDYDHDR